MSDDLTFVHAEYERLSGECCRVAGPGGFYWNERFVSALNRRGLSLTTIKPAEDQTAGYPHEMPMQAPLAYHEGPDGWPVGSMMVWTDPLPQVIAKLHLMKGIQ